MVSSVTSSSVVSDTVPFIFRENSTVRYFKDATKATLHRVDGPAVETRNGSKIWYLHGVYHRVDGPAVIWHDGQLDWYENGKRHRIDGPAITRPNGFEEWWVNGELHREDGPAVVDRQGALEWYQNGVRHRLDGPAVVRKSNPSHNVWCLFGINTSPAIVGSFQKALLLQFGEEGMNNLPYEVLKEIFLSSMSES